MKKIASCLILFLMATAACKKSNGDPKPANAARKALLTGTWKLTSQTYSPAYDYNQDGTPETEAYPVMEPCEKDDLITLLNDGTWKKNPGSVCDWDDDLKDSGHWTLSEDGNTFTGSGSELEWTILQLDEHIFKYQVKFLSPEDGITYTVTLTMTRQ